MNDEELDRMIARLPSEILPQRDLWPSIEAGLRKPATGLGYGGRSQRIARWAGVAGLAAAMAAFLVYVLRPESEISRSWAGADPILSEIAVPDVHSPQGNKSIPDPGFRVPPSGQDRQAEGQFEVSSPERWFVDHQAAVSILEAIFVEKRETLDPKLAVLLVDGMAVLDEEINQSQLAWTKQPDDLTLMAYVQDAYQSKLELLDWANSLEE